MKHSDRSSDDRLTGAHRVLSLPVAVILRSNQVPKTKGPTNNTKWAKIA